MIRLDFKLDIQQALQKLNRLPEEVSEKAIVMALNKTADQAKTQSAREIRDAGYGLKVGAIKKAIDIKRASRTTLVAVVKATGRPIALINYGARQTKSGVTVAVKNGRKLIRGAFIATMPNGHTGVFTRTDKKEKGTAGKPNRRFWTYQVIKEEFGPSIPSAFMNQVVQDALIESVREKFPKNFRHELNYLRLKG